MRTRVPPSIYTGQSDYYYAPDYKGNYPDYPGGGYDAYSYAQPQYNDTESVTRLAAAAAPIAGQNDAAAYGNYVVDPNDAYYSNNGYTQGQYSHSQYTQGHYAQGNYGQDQYSQQQYYTQDQYAQQQGQGQNAYSQTQHAQGRYDVSSDLSTIGGLPYDSSVRGSGATQGYSSQLQRGSSAQAGNPGSGQAR